MIYLSRFLTGLLILLTAVVNSLFSNPAGKNIPMKPYPAVGITDGEYLHYGEYGKIKNTDLYFLTKKETNLSGDTIYRTYCDYIPVASRRKKAENYKNWPAVIVVDPKSGSVIETEVKLDPNDFDSWAAFGNKGVFYWHYQLYGDKGYFEYITRSLKGGQTNECKIRGKVRDGFPYEDMVMYMIYSPRFLDFHKGGVLYSIAVQNTEPKSVSWEEASKETIRTKAGSFETMKIKGVFADPFVNPFLVSIIKSLMHGKEITWYVEESNRKLVVLLQTLMTDFVLEEVATVK